MFFLRTQVAINVFHQIPKNCHFGVKKNHYLPIWISMTNIWSPTLFPRAIIIFQGVQTKFHFLTKFPHLEEFVDVMKDLKYEHQSTNMNTKFWCGGGWWSWLLLFSKEY